MNKLLAYLLIALALMAYNIVPVLTHAQDVRAAGLIDNNYRIELTQFPNEDLKAGSPMNFVLTMQNLSNRRVVKSSAWIRVVQDGQEYFASPDFKSVDGEIEFTYTFPQSGDYSLDVRMINDTTLEEATVTFQLEVDKGKLLKEETFEQAGPDRTFALLTLTLGGIGGAAIYWGLSGRKKEKDLG